MTVSRMATAIFHAQKMQQVPAVVCAKCPILCNSQPPSPTLPCSHCPFSLAVVDNQRRVQNQQTNAHVFWMAKSI